MAELAGIDVEVMQQPPVVDGLLTRAAQQLTEAPRLQLTLGSAVECRTGDELTGVGPEAAELRPCRMHRLEQPLE